VVALFQYFLVINFNMRGLDNQSLVWKNRMDL
jgi:hypothetical protein